MEPHDRNEFAELRNSELKTARAWALKETAMALYSYVYERRARKHFRWWRNWAVLSLSIARVARYQKTNFNPICLMRGSCALAIATGESFPVEKLARASRTQAGRRPQSSRTDVVDRNQCS